MRRLYKILASVIFLIVPVVTTYAQQESSLRDRLAKKQQQANPQNSQNVPRLSVRAETSNLEQVQNLGNASWVREIYRLVDLEKGRNAALYYPTQEVDGRMNLYTMIFKLMANGDLTAYDYIDANREIFTDQYKVDFKDVLERLEIPFNQSGNTFTYNDFDIPSNEVRAYYVKEAWYFDQNNSVLDTKIIAICPIVFRQDDFGVGSTRYPQFWIPYENIRPYAARMPIMTSDINNLAKSTVDDFFRMHLFEGEIYKTTNMENKILADRYKTPEAQKAAREKIEDELKQFEKNLWVVNDSTYIKDNEIKSKKEEKDKLQKEGRKQAKQAKSKSKSSATYSARDRRS